MVGGSGSCLFSKMEASQDSNNMNSFITFNHAWACRERTGKCRHSPSLLGVLRNCTSLSLLCSRHLLREGNATDLTSLELAAERICKLLTSGGYKNNRCASRCGRTRGGSTLIHFLLSEHFTYFELILVDNRLAYRD